MQNNKTSWLYQKHFGEAAQQRVLDWARQRWAVEDVSQVASWQRRDTDAIISGITVEIKADSHEPINLFLETDGPGGYGWLFKSRAQRLLYFFPKAGVLYSIPFAYLLLWASTHLRQYPKRVIASRHGRNEWTTTGYIVPIADLVAAGVPMQKAHL